MIVDQVKLFGVWPVLIQSAELNENNKLVVEWIISPGNDIYPKPRKELSSIMKGDTRAMRALIASLDDMVKTYVFKNYLALLKEANNKEDLNVIKSKFNPESKGTA